MSVDVGANIGDTAAIIRSVCPAPIVCIEGDEMIGRVLNENLYMLGDTTAVHVYLSDSREERNVCIQKSVTTTFHVPTRVAYNFFQCLRISALGDWASKRTSQCGMFQDAVGPGAHHMKRS